MFFNALDFPRRVLISLWAPWDLASFELLNVHPIFKRNVLFRKLFKRNRTLDTLRHPLPNFQNKIVT
jgi:hypothetical protein